MNDLIDIHTHIIPGVDDGAQLNDVAKLMIERYQENGFTTVFATPHTPIIPDTEYVEKLSDGYEMVLQLGADQGTDVRKGFEVRLSPELLVDDSSLSSFGLAGTKFVLLDFP